MIKSSRIALSFSLIQMILFSTILHAREATTFFNQQWLKSVVSIEQGAKHKKEFRPIGTGFLVQSHNKSVILVTAKHVVVDEEGKIKNNLVYRLNLKNGESYVVHEDFLQKDGVDTWFLSNKSDVAVRFLLKRKESDLLTIPLTMFIDKDHIQPGTPALILGFPMGLRSKKYATPIVRRAMVALNEPNRLIVDGFAFPGNSGGPVVYMPAHQIGMITLNNYVAEQRLIGVVSG